MCGIVGQFTYNLINDSVDPIVKAITQRMLLSESLVHMEPRGKDSTGVALLWSDKQTAVLKQPVPVSDWARDDGMFGEDYENPDDKEAHFDWLMKIWMRGIPDVTVKQALGHVRKKTVGSEYNMHNNHPIIIRPNGVDQGSIGDGKDLLIGVHNGSIDNVETLFNKYDFNRIGQVDSEVIFQMMYKYKDDITKENLKETFDELNGVFATLAFNPQKPNIVGGMREIRPLDGAYIKQLGTVMLISERKYLDAALLSYDRWRVREAESVFSINDTKGNIQQVGKVKDVFPYLTCDWHTTFTAGVFVLDTDTEVDENTKVKDLVDIKYISKPVTNTRKTYNNTHTGNTTTYSNNRPAKPATPEPATAQAGTKDADTEVMDLSPYDEKLEQADAAAMEEVTVEAIIDEGDIREILDDGCPYQWEERLNWAIDALYEADANGDNRLLICKLNELDMKEVLDKYLIEVTDEEKARAEFASFYDLVFPEGFALGVQHGYSLAADEYDATTAMDDDDNEKLTNRIEELERATQAKDKALKKLSDKLQEVEKQRCKAAEQISTMGPIYRYFLRKKGILHKTTNRPDKARLEKLYKKAQKSNEQFTKSVSNQIAEKLR